MAPSSEESVLDHIARMAVAAYHQQQQHVDPRREVDSEHRQRDLDGPTTSRRTDVDLRAATAHNSTTPFFRIPAEIRNQIYAAIFNGSQCPLQLKVPTSEHQFRQAQSSIRHVLQVCRQLATEVTPFFNEMVTPLGFQTNEQDVRLLQQLRQSPFDIRSILRFHYLTEAFDLERDVQNITGLIHSAESLERLDISLLDGEGEHEFSLGTAPFLGFMLQDPAVMQEMFKRATLAVRISIEDWVINTLLRCLRNPEEDAKPVVVLRETFKVLEAGSGGHQSVFDGGATYLNLTGGYISWHVGGVILGTYLDRGLDFDGTDDDEDLGEYWSDDEDGSNFILAEAPQRRDRRMRFDGGMGASGKRGPSMIGNLSDVLNLQ